MDERLLLIHDKTTGLIVMKLGTQIAGDKNNR